MKDLELLQQHQKGYYKHLAKDILVSDENASNLQGFIEYLETQYQDYITRIEALEAGGGGGGSTSLGRILHEDYTNLNEPSGTRKKQIINSNFKDGTWQQNKQSWVELYRKEYNLPRQLAYFDYLESLESSYSDNKFFKLSTGENILKLI